VGLFFAIEVWQMLPSENCVMSNISLKRSLSKILGHQPHFLAIDEGLAEGTLNAFIPLSVNAIIFIEVDMSVVQEISLFRL
jgi:hypothetical protein